MTYTNINFIVKMECGHKSNKIIFYAFKIISIFYYYIFSGQSILRIVSEFFKAVLTARQRLSLA